MKYIFGKIKITEFIFVMVFCSSTLAQFIDNFNDDILKIDRSGMHGWTFRMGGGNYGAVLHYNFR